MTAILLQSVTSVITKSDRCYKVRQFYYKVRQVLQSAMIITKCDRTGLHTEKRVFSVAKTAMIGEKKVHCNTVQCIEHDFEAVFTSFSVLQLELSQNNYWVFGSEIISRITAVCACVIACGRL